MIDCQDGWTQASLEHCVGLLSNGAIAVLPTDTVYGIGCDADNPNAVMRVLAAKGRGRQMPPPVLVSSHDHIRQLCVDIPQSAFALADAYWPGALTIILTARPDLGWDLGETGGTLALRMPDHAHTLKLLDTFGPLAVTSANMTGMPPATKCQQAVEYFGDGVDLYIDAGPATGGVASTIIDFAHGAPRIIREGAIEADQIVAFLGQEISRP